MLDNKKFYHDLDMDKIKINWNKNPIEMIKFLSFLTIPVILTNDGSRNNLWTVHENKDHKLIIGGGIVNRIEYLDRLQFGEKLDNNYNNYVNPFYLFGIMNDQGKKFFFEYYKEEIIKIKQLTVDYIKQLREEIKEERALIDEIKLESQGYISV